MAKVLLIYPPWYTLLGMQCRAAVLKKAGHEAGIRLLQRHGIPVNIYVMMGLPTETEKDVEETMAFARKLVGKMLPAVGPAV